MNFFTRFSKHDTCSVCKRINNFIETKFDIKVPLFDIICNERTVLTGSFSFL